MLAAVRKSMIIINPLRRRTIGDDRPYNIRTHGSEFASLTNGLLFSLAFAAFDRRVKLKVTLGTAHLQLYRGLMTKALTFCSLLSGFLASTIKADFYQQYRMASIIE